MNLIYQKALQVYLQRFLIAPYQASRLPGKGTADNSFLSLPQQREVGFAQQNPEGLYKRYCQFEDNAK